jgi:hypothetical protein
MFTGTKLINLSTGKCISSSANCDYEIVNVYAKSNSGEAININGFSAKLTNAYAYSESNIAIIIGGGTAAISSCIGISNSAMGIYVNSGTVTDCTGISSASYGIQSNGGRLNNCRGFSSANYGIYALYCNIYSCFGYSSANVGLGMINSPTFASDCTGYSTASYGIQSSDALAKSLVNCTAISDAATALLIWGQALNCAIICNWNNVGGHGIWLNNIATISNCTIKTTNATANSIYASSAITAKYANNSYIGATTPVNANVTQGITNTQDNQGNILIN